LSKSVLNHRRVWATATMTKPFVDYWLRKPTKAEVLEAIASLIQLGKLDDHFEISLETEVSV